jgi:hypothetical protein
MESRVVTSKEELGVGAVSLQVDAAPSETVRSAGDHAARSRETAKGTGKRPFLSSSEVLN